MSVRFCSASLSSTTTPALTTSYAIRPAYVDNDGIATATAMDVDKQGVGAIPTLGLFASVTQTTAGTMTAIVLKAQVSYTGTDPTTAAAANWTDILITNLSGAASSSTGATGIEHTITGVNDATVYAAFGTESNRNARYLRVLVKSVTGDAAAGESAVVYAVAS